MFEPDQTLLRMWAIMFLLLLPIGCGKRGPDVFGVSGQVTYKDNAITSGSVTFAPKGGGDLIVVAISDDGGYQLQAPVGTYEVGVASMAEIAEGREGFEQQSVKPTLPGEYSYPSRSGVVVTVVEKELNQIDIQLK